MGWRSSPSRSRRRAGARATLDIARRRERHAGALAVVRRRQRRVGARAALAVALCCAAAGVAGPAGAAAPDAANQARLDATVRYLQDVQNMDGGFGGAAGKPSDADVSAWAAFALAAAGINPRDQARPGGTDVYTYLIRSTKFTQTTDYDRVLLDALAAGAPVHDFGGVDLVAAILARRLPDGSFPQSTTGKIGWVNSTIWSLLPLSAIHTPATDAAVQQAATWVIANQNKNGSWSSSALGSAQDVDMTGAALQALSVAGRGADPAVAKALEFLHTMQNPDAGFPEVNAGTRSNVASTGWVVQGLWSLGIDPRSPEWTKAGGNPLDYMASLQQPSGLICWRVGDCVTNPLWMTAQVAPAFAGVWYPLAEVPRADPSAPQPAGGNPAQGPSSPLPGAGGAGSTGGGKVIAGGGGNGSPLFARPKPQSKGKTAGGVRRVTAEKPRRAAAGRRTPPREPAARHDGTPASRRLATRRAARRAASRRSGTGTVDAGGLGAGADGSGRGGGGSGAPAVSGVVIGGPGAKAAGEEGLAGLAAPGLRSAQAGGGDDPAAALVLAGALALALATGVGLERRRPWVPL